MDNIDALYSIVVDRMRQRSTAAWLQRLTEADVPHGQVMNLQDLVDSPYLRDTGFLRRVEHPSEGPMLTTAVTMNFSRTPGELRLPPPRLGQHTEEVLAAIGYTAEQIDTATDRQG
jgi:crotonobetainyl-CoA:carnitine CoA-transferase CaiB-like acyl-CoA transferase